MSNESIAIDTPYRIMAAGGGLLQLSTGSVGETLTLVPDTQLDEQQWVFWPSATSTAWKIENYRYDTFWVDTGTSGTGTLLVSGREATAKEWYVMEAESPYYYVCGDPACATAWIPYALSGGGSTATSVALAQARSANSEFWRIVLASSPVPTPATDTLTSLATTSTTSFSPVPTFIRTTTQSETATSPYPPVSTDSSTEKERNLQVLQKCDPCGKSKCEFTPSGEPSRESYSVLMGLAVGNCDSNSQSDTVTKIGGSIELERSWTIQTTSGAGLGNFGPSISLTTTVGYGDTKRFTVSQETEVTIKKGQRGGLVANVSYTAQEGMLKVNKELLSFMAIEPQNILGISVVYASCDQPFQALETPRKIVCKGNSGLSSRTKRAPFAFLFVAWALANGLLWPVL